MIAVEKLQKAQQTNRSHICLGLDLDPKKMPSDHSGTLKGMFEFAQRIIEATSDQVCAYKPNLAFYESHGPDGLALLKLIVERIPDHIPVILDGKRNDIGNSASQYANAVFDRYHADWVTVNPYMGYDSMRPFLERKDRGAFILCLTSNAGSKDFQLLEVNGTPLYKIVAGRIKEWNKDNNCGLVVGATHPEQLKEVRALAGNMPILIPGVGAQGGSLEQAIEAGTDKFQRLAVVNVSRSVLYASNGPDFAERARQEVIKLNGIVTRVRYGDKPPDKPQGPSDSHPKEAVEAPRTGDHRDPKDRHHRPPHHDRHNDRRDGRGRQGGPPPAPPASQPTGEQRPQSPQPPPAQGNQRSEPPPQPSQPSGEQRPQSPQPPPAQDNQQSGPPPQPSQPSGEPKPQDDRSTGEADSERSGHQPPSNG